MSECIRKGCDKPRLEDDPHELHCFDHSRCAVEGCDKLRQHSNGLCRSHTLKWMDLRERTYRRFLQGKPRSARGVGTTEGRVIDE